MPEPQRTQKQVAEKYKGNLDYYRRGHFLRRLRWMTFLLVAALSLGIALTYAKWGRQSFFTTGPISQNHAAFIHDCQLCHEKAEPDLARGLGVEAAAADPVSALTRLRDWINQAPTALGALRPDRFHATAEHALKNTSLAEMDRACIKCHEPQKLHQPQSAALGLRSVHTELPLVFSGACASCHQEHVTTARMLLPRSDKCVTCHNDPAQLAATRQIIDEPGPKLAQAVVAELGDRQRHFVMPRPVEPVAFQSFAAGHPKFGYEQPGAFDPGTIKFNHQRHFASDIPPLGGRKLDCASCHQTEPKGAFMERISYAQHCAQCHSLQLDPSMPGLNLPHRDPDAVRGFARTLSTRIAEYALRVHGITDPEQRKRYAIEKYTGFTQRRGIRYVEDIEAQVFLSGYPALAESSERAATSTNQEMIACSKCHQVTPGVEFATPTLAPSGIADRWLSRGPFNHLAHEHMNCADCHANSQNSVINAALSTQTSDVLLPKKEMCASCHRPLARDRVQAIPADFDRARIREAVTAKQRREGGVKEDCQSCHEFHAPRAVSQFLRSLEQVRK